MACEKTWPPPEVVCHYCGAVKKSVFCAQRKSEDRVAEEKMVVLFSHNRVPIKSRECKGMLAF